MAEDERPDAPQDEQAPGAEETPGEAAAAPAEEPAAEETPAAEEPAAPAEEAPPAPAAAEEPTTEEPAEPAAEEPAPAAAEEPAEPAAEEPAPAAAQEPAAEEPPPAAAAEPAAEEPAPAAAEEQRRQRPPRRDEEQPAEEAVVPGAHLEPDLVLDDSRPQGEGEFDPYAETTATAGDEVPVAEGEEAAAVDEAPAARTPLDLAADARYPATGKRKRAIARVILKPGQGTYTINGKALDAYFPRATLQKNARLPLETAGYETRMDVVAKIHGGGVSSQAIALRHGIARALVEADPNLRTELKRHGFLTRDARVKERKKAGLKKARKRPQFSKR
jgi:small subunit ribosomal protein S9